MELIPRALIVGAYLAPSAPSIAPFPNVAVSTREILTDIWSEVTRTYPYQSLQFAPTGDGAQFLGSSMDEGVLIQPPLLQVRDTIPVGGVQQSADRAMAIIRIAERHLRPPQLFNLGIKLIYNAPTASNDAISFVLRDLLHQTEESVNDLRAGGALWMGAKYVVEHGDYLYLILVEPFRADPKLLYIDIDAQFPGPVASEQIASRVMETDSFVHTTVLHHLEKASSS